MTENLARRGEGLAGLVEKLLATLKELLAKECMYMNDPFMASTQCSEIHHASRAVITEAEAALEAAARLPAPTAEQARLGEALETLMVKWRHEGFDSAMYAKELAEVLRRHSAALATPTQKRLSGYELAGCADRSGVVVYLDGCIGNDRLMVAADWDRFAKEVNAALATPSPQAPQEQSSALSTTSAREQSSATASDSLDVAVQTILKPHWPVVRNMEESEARQREVKRIIEIIEGLTWQAAKEESDKWYGACRNPHVDDPRAFCIAKAVRK